MEEQRGVALIMVDVQRDFCPGGALAVPLGDRVVRPLNRIKHVMEWHGSLIIASRCWHPEKTIHFQIFNPHCIRHTLGAEFHPKLDVENAIIISKGTKQNEHAFSAFDGISQNGNSLENILTWNETKLVIVGGLALGFNEYCVAATALDAKRRNFKVVVLKDAVRALKPKDREKALEYFVQKDVEVMTVSDAIKKFFPKNLSTIFLPEPC